MRLIWSTPSITDLLAIDEWLAQNADQRTSENNLDRIRKKARQLRDFPGSGPDVHNGLRSVGVLTTNYILIYRIIDRGVEIVRIRHNRENWRDEMDEVD